MRSRLSHGGGGADPEALRSGLDAVVEKAGEADQPLEFRRLSWGAEDGVLSILVQGTDLDDLQALEQALRASGLQVRSGAASAGDGAAEVEMRVSRGGEG